MKKYIIPTVKTKKVESQGFMDNNSLPINPGETVTTVGAKGEPALSDNNPTWL